MSKTISKNRSHRAGHTKDEGDGFASSLQRTIRALLLTMGLSLVLLLLMSLIAYFYTDPLILITPLALITSALTAFLGGFINLRFHKSGALVNGLIMGCLLELLMLPASLFFKEFSSGYSPVLSVLLHVGFMLLSVSGAFVSISIHPKKKRRK